MANLTPSATFDDVFQLETTSVALGGPGATMNLQAQALVNRTQYLYVQLSNLAAVASTGDYNSLINRPALGSAAYQSSGAFATAAQGAKADGAAQASALSSVAFSGSYNDLSNRPFASDAPSDGNVYGRKNGAWSVSVAGTPLVNPMTESGDMIVGGSDGEAQRIGIGTEGQILKSKSGNVTWSSNLGSPVNDLSISSGVVNIDCSLGDYFSLIITENVTSLTLSNLPEEGTGRTLSILITQDSTGSWTFSIPSSFKLINGSSTSINSSPNSVTKIVIESMNGGTTWDYVMAGRST